jgi:hypothetical protein
VPTSCINWGPLLEQSREFSRSVPRLPKKLDPAAAYAYSKESGNAAEIAAKAILESRGNTPRLYRNTPVFLAADRVRLQDLDEALRRYLAWASIVTEKDTLNLDPHQARQAGTQRSAAEGAVIARLPETYQWLLVPEQLTPKMGVVWQAVRLTGSDALAVRVSKKLRSDELLVATLGSTILRKHLDGVPLWRRDNVSVKQLVDDFARYIYLPRLSGPEVLAQSVRDGVALLTWRKDTFAFAEGYDEAAGRYRGLRASQGVNVGSDTVGLVVKPDVAARQLDADLESEKPRQPAEKHFDQGGREIFDPLPPPPAPAAQQLRRFHGSVRIDPSRMVRDAGRIADEVIAHLATQTGADVTVTIEIEAPQRRKRPTGAHRDRKQPCAEVRQPGIREGVNVIAQHWSSSDDRLDYPYRSTDRAPLRARPGVLSGLPLRTDACGLPSCPRLRHLPARDRGAAARHGFEQTG